MKNEHTLEAPHYRSGGLDDYSLGFVYNISKVLLQTEEALWTAQFQSCTMLFIQLQEWVCRCVT